MRELSELIEYENENTSLDFKSQQYKKEQNENFLKDIMSLANANTKDEKFIIIGVKHYSDGSRDFLGIEEQFIDDASYQQLVDANIEPNIGFKYYPFRFEDKTFGVFEITDCSNPPYMMKKDYGKLKLGESFIRKGSFQNRLTRKDIDNHQNSKTQIDISGEIFVSFVSEAIIKDKKFNRQIIELPSEIFKEKIQRIIIDKEREQLERDQREKNLLNIQKLYIPRLNFSSGFTKYEDRDLDTLRANLQDIKKTYLDDDEYCKNETTSYKMNFFIHNNSSSFLEDVSVEVLIPVSNNYYIRDSICRKPQSYSQMIQSPMPVASYEELHYPNVVINDSLYKVYEEVGNVKHKLPARALDVSLRLVLENNNSDVSFEITVRIFAKNIKQPIEERLTVLFE